MTDYQTLTFDARDGIGWLTLNRPEKRNALDNALRTALFDALATHGTGRPSVDMQQARAVAMSGWAAAARR